MENQDQQKPDKNQATVVEKKPVEKYWKVMFSDKGSTNDPDDVQLSVNGETLVIQRSTEVVIPDRFKVAADNATYPQFKQVPGKPRKLRGTIKIFPYQLMGEASAKDFLKMKKLGDKQTKEIIAKFGFDGVPDGG